VLSSVEQQAHEEVASFQTDFSLVLSVWHYSFPYLQVLTLPDLLTIPIAFVDSIHFFGDIVNAFAPASFLNPSNSMGLKSEVICQSYS
jgi:hypothetical protein